MADATRLVRDDAYEEMGAAYQCVLVAALDGVLRRQRMSEAARRKVCEQFLFEVGTFHDQGWLKPTADAEPVYPPLCFSKRFLNTDTPVGELGEVYAPSVHFSFHEYAAGSVDHIYDGDPTEQVETGDFSGEG